MMWLGLGDDVKGSHWVVGREHKRAFQPKKDVHLSIAFSGLSPNCHQVLNLSFRY